MTVEPFIPAERLKSLTDNGYWRDELLMDYFEQHVKNKPNEIFITGFNSAIQSHYSLSFRQMQLRVNRIAIGLAQHGVEKGDVVSFQLPNWWQFVAIHFACLKIGAISNPVMPIFRHNEITFMLGFAESKVMIVPKQFRNFDYPQMMQELRTDLPKLEHVFVIDGEGETSFENTFLNRRWEDEIDADKLFQERLIKPNDVIEIIYTSGTTGQPKGVMHTSNTLVGMPKAITDLVELKGEQIYLMASPLAHQTGVLMGILLPTVTGSKVVLQDIWDAETAYQLIQDEGVTYTMASTPFLADLISCPNREKYDLSHFKYFLSGGAPIPRAQVHKAKELLGANIVSVWGMSETGGTTYTPPSAADEKVYETDGKPLAGMEVRILGPEGEVLPYNTEGRLQCKGPFLFAGYLKRPEANDIDSDGWFETGDNARLDEDGYIRITGRSKDIIIRGAENIPVVEVENALYKHPDIEDVAVVAMPDERLGERACAIVQLNKDSNFNLDDLKEHLNNIHFTKTYWPERVEVLSEFPRTPSGKIQKFKLREMAKNWQA